MGTRISETEIVCDFARMYACMRVCVYVCSVHSKSYVDNATGQIESMHANSLKLALIIFQRSLFGSQFTEPK